MDANLITRKIIGASIKVHKALGPGLLESPYKECLAYQLITDGLGVEREKPIPLIYEGVKLDCGFRLDLLVEKQVIVEVKAAERLIPVFDAQMITYLKLTGCAVGLLINFNEKTLIAGVRRIVNNYQDLFAISASSAVKK